MIEQDGYATESVRRVDLGHRGVISGVVDHGYGQVMDTFIANFEERGDVGAGCTVYVGGRLVADVWGGIADQRSARPWQHDTPAVIFSCSKGILAICVYRLVQDGLVDLDEPITTVWPEFGEAGKDTITIRNAMSHRAGLPVLDADMTQDEVLAWDPVIREIERQRPGFNPDEGHAYHALTYGWLVGEIIRRVTGQMPGQYFRSSISNPLDLDTWIGLPAEHGGSVAWMEPPLPDEDSADARESARLRKENPMIERSLTMGGAFAFPDDNGVVTFNHHAIQAAQVPGANGISTAPSLARLYAACISDIDGAALLTSTSIRDATQPLAFGQQLTGIPDDGARWGTGFQLASPPSQPMLGPTSFGHAGAGGQLGFADLEHRVGFAYLSNQMGGYGDARARLLTDALHRILGASES